MNINVYFCGVFGLGVCKLGEELLLFEFDNGVGEDVFDELFDDDINDVFSVDVNGRFWSGVEDNWF